MMLRAWKRLRGTILLLVIMGVVMVLIGAGCLHVHRYEPTGRPHPEAPAIQSNLKATVDYLAGTVGERNVYRSNTLAGSCQWIADRLADIGYRVPQRIDFPVPARLQLDASRMAAWATNLAVQKVGASRPREVIVIGAHYDTMGFSRQWSGSKTNRFRLAQPGTPGANDNASGVAALIEIARLLQPKPLARTVRFVAFANEEPPFFQEPDGMGSYLYAKQCRAAGEAIRMMISLDAVGVYTWRGPHEKRRWPETWFLRLIGLREHPDYVAFMSNWEADSGRKTAAWARAFSTNGTVAVRTVSLPFLPLFGKEIFAWSDDWSFTRMGYPAFTVTDTAMYRSDRYHHESDTPEALIPEDYRTFAGVVAGLAGMIEAQANQ